MESALSWIKPLYFVLLGAFVVLVVLTFVSSSEAGVVPAVALAPFAVLGFYDVVQKQNAILRNFPVVGHLRLLAEAISPEIQQYFIERHTDGAPINRNHRHLVYARADGHEYTHPFGTEMDLDEVVYRGLGHRLVPAKIMEDAPRVEVGGRDCAQPYAASLLNVSAMSFGALGPTAIESLTGGAKLGGFAVNTGEGSISPYHLAGGGDLIWQIGTGYFGCRTLDGRFDPESFAKSASRPEVKMIELKLSQGAKPGHGGVLPAKKNTLEIAAIRLVEPHTTVLSPPGHSEFGSIEGLLHFVARLRELSGGKPVGFKLCVGRRADLVTLCRTMVALDITPDFITVDGAEGGTGAAPLEYSDSVGVPLRKALPTLHSLLIEHGLRDRLKLVASGKIITAFDILEALALGADLVNMARAFMLSIGCIQAQRCNTNACPSGVATLDPRLYTGLVVEDKRVRAANFHRLTLNSVLELSAATGVSDPRSITFDAFVGERIETMHRE